MLLKDVRPSHDPALEHMLRYVNDGSRSGYQSQFPDPFDPFCDAPSFQLPYVELRAHDPALLMSSGTHADDVNHVVMRDDRVRVYIFPPIWSIYGYGSWSVPRPATSATYPSSRPARSHGCERGPTRASASSCMVRRDRWQSAACNFTYGDAVRSKISEALQRPSSRSLPRHPSRISTNRSPSTINSLTMTASARCCGRRRRSRGTAGGLLIPGYAFWSPDRRRPADPPILQQIVEAARSPAGVDDWRPRAPPAV